MKKNMTFPQRVGDGVDSSMRQPPTEPPGGEQVDRFGAVASSLCAVHCAVGALLPATFGALGLGFVVGHEAEWVFTLVAVAFAAGALILGWRRHRSLLVAGLLVLGIVGLLTSRGLEAGSEHHGHHGESHGATVEQAVSHDHAAAHDPHDGSAGHHVEHGRGHAEHGRGHSAHQGAAHLAGTAVGVFGGLLLLFGHILNIRTSRQHRKACPT